MVSKDMGRLKLFITYETSCLLSAVLWIASCLYGHQQLEEV